MALPDCDRERRREKCRERLPSIALRTALNTPPQELGYGLSVWSLARLNAHLKKLTQIGFSEDQLGRIVHAEGFSFQRPKHTIKGKRDEVAYTRAAAKLKTIKKRDLRRRKGSLDLSG